MNELQKALYDIKNINQKWFEMFAGNLTDKKEDEIKNCLFNYFVDYNSKLKKQINELFFCQDFDVVDKNLRKLIYHGKGKITNFFSTKKLSQKIWKKYGENPKYNIAEVEENELKKRIEKILRCEI